MRKKAIVLYYSGVARESASVINEQKERIEKMDPDAIAAAHELKKDPLLTKKAPLTSDVAAMARVLGHSWEAKKKIASRITNRQIDVACDAAAKAGAISGKISGAGGGGFMILMTKPPKRLAVINALQNCGGRGLPFHFSQRGTEAWIACT